MLTDKLIVSLVILLIGFIFGLIPLFSRADNKLAFLLNYGESFARGIFLGAGLIHLLPDAANGFRAIYPNLEYPLIFAMCAFVIFLLYFLEQGLSERLETKMDQKINWLPYLLVLLLSIHSFIEGMALGVTASLLTFFIIFTAIIAHKGAAAFALGINLRSHQFSIKKQTILILLFSLMTPIGILCGSGLHHFLTQHGGDLMESLFDSIAAGTFLYIAMFSGHKQCEMEHQTSIFIQTIWMAIGLLLMAIIAAWI